MSIMKKILVSAILGISLVTTMAMPALATALFQSTGHTINLPGTDSWTRGIRDGGNGYYMAYSYYDNVYYQHASRATIDGFGETSPIHPLNSTSLANSYSEPSYANALILATNWKSGVKKTVQDDGQGDYVSYNW